MSEKNSINYSLSGEDIVNLLDYKCNLVAYPDIRRFNSINELLGKYKKCIILYLNNKNYGHWTCIYEYDGTIFFFDSYGIKPNGQLNWIPNHMNKELKQDHKHLLKLLYDSKKPIEYNEYPLQKFGNGINTCGKWVVFRLKYPFLSVNEFKNLFYNKNIPPDNLVNGLVKF
jgi:hypothetical protein